MGAVMGLCPNPCKLFGLCVPRFFARVRKKLKITTDIIVQKFLKRCGETFFKKFPHKTASPTTKIHPRSGWFLYAKGICFMTGRMAFTMEAKPKSVGWQPSTVPSSSQRAARVLPSIKYTFLSPRASAFS